LRRLKGGVPRAFPSHRGAAAALYGRHGRAWAARFNGQLPEDIRPLVRLAGRLLVEIEGLEADYDGARVRRRLSDARRIRRMLTGARTQFLRTEDMLATRAAEHAAAHPRGPASFTWQGGTS
jgi:fermentation-respiration switch protein FrsA (DUF1100 family)